MPAADVVRGAYRTAVGIATRAALMARAPSDQIAVFFGGARRGDFGGPLVKVRLLSERFPERPLGFSILYLLSNANYLPDHAIAAVRGAGIPIILNQNGVYYPAWYPQGWERENARLASVHASADHVLYQSEFCRHCAEKFLGKRSGASEILYNAVDTEHFRPAPNTSTTSPFTFLLTGKIVPSTGYRLFSSIEGLAAARNGGLDVRLTIAGMIDAAIMTEAHLLAERLKVSNAIKFVGPFTGLQAPEIYQAADAYLMTKHNDPCPNVVLEALACGLPVLYSASGGVPELVGEAAGVGLVVPETFGDTPTPEPIAIADGMANVIKNRKKMAQAARARAVDRFRVSAWLDRHEALFKDLISKRSVL